MNNRSDQALLGKLEALRVEPRSPRERSLPSQAPSSPSSTSDDCSQPRSKRRLSVDTTGDSYSCDGPEERPKFKRLTRRQSYYTNLHALISAHDACDAPRRHDGLRLGHMMSSSS